MNSPRGIPLLSGEDWVFEGMTDDPDALRITVEDYEKWYDLYLVGPAGAVPVPFMELEEYTSKSPCVDHVPNPAAVERMARVWGWRICGRAMEVMLGRWWREGRNRRPVDME